MSVTVVGDLLLDRDLVGSVSRVCPDAPAPVLDVEDELARPGGAGLAAALLSAEGQEVTLVASIGADSAGERLRTLLDDYGVRLVALPTDSATRQKVRVRAGDQSLVRLDIGSSCPPSQVPGAAVEALQGCEAVLVCDYAGGVTADRSLRAALGSAAAHHPLVWDPHVRGAAPVRGARLVTPNKSEAAALSGLAPAGEGGELAGAARQADALLAQWQAHAVCVTLGAHGALLTYGDGPPFVVPAATVRGGDTCGAGDRFAATAAGALGTGSLVSSAVEQAVSAASTFVATGGAAGFCAPRREPAPVRAAGWDRVEQVRAQGGTVVATGGCFDLLHAGHVGLLYAARSLGDCLVVCLNTDESVRRLKGDARPVVSQDDRVRVLLALECVDAVLLFGEDTPAEALQGLRPDVWAKGGDYALADVPEAAVLAQWGGQTVVLPYLHGRSTTTMIAAARRCGAKEAS
ncbi:MAG: D-beta-D-heptose 7-phosphate kinase / D-beta-D-heptose 1-phosphate adenosyltransferase [Actinomycetota bacterium]|jgi:rfaE bifunctional protein nucleotidyltransferase chain/domain/rfaE bifunctional protein kinase chain/domain|nr:D-beta-D-heptose 7-phosphate kinase / D-beta-D-heptose 1-phosphate adenosyltransferase [Actinomycetota bacterium]